MLRTKQLQTLSLLATALVIASGQLSNPIVLDSQVDSQDNKWLQRRAFDDDGPPGANDEVSVSGQCDANIALKWMTEVSSSIYATPVITDLFSDGHKDIIVPSFVHYLEVLDGGNGGRAAEDGWPAYHKSTVHASPLLVDLDGDNVDDILVATYDGELLAFRDTGELLPLALSVPRLRVRKDWYRGLAEDFIDHSHPDIGATPAADQGDEAESGQSGRRRLLEQFPAGPDVVISPENLASRARRRPLEQTAENAGELPEDAEASFAELFGGGGDEQPPPPPPGGRAGDAHDAAAVAEMAGANEVTWDSLPVDADGLGGADWRNRYDAQYGDYRVEPEWRTLHDHAWADEAYFAAPHRHDAGFLYLDAHVLCTPALGDLDGDGAAELVVASSHFFDRDYYDLPEHKAELGKDVDAGKYVGGAVTVFDLATRQVRWTQHLDLSTDHTQFRAYIYSAPTLADIDADGKLEILVGTSMGFLYVLDHSGRVRDGWPMQMGEIQAQVAVADLLGDGVPAIVAADARGSVAAFDADANELWERHLGSLIAQAPTFADVNGDGDLEVLFGCTSGGIYALSGRTGMTLPGFPVHTQGRIMAPVLPVRVRPGPAMQLVVPSYDGHLYIVDGITGCADVVDVGETAYAAALADDLDGDGRLDLLLATMNGNVYAFQSAMPMQPAAAWRAQLQGPAGFTSPDGWLSVAATPDARRTRDAVGQRLDVRFELRDPRYGPANSTLAPYTVVVSLRGVGKREMNAGEEPVIGITDKFSSPGTYSLQVPCPRTRSAATVRIEVRDARGHTAADEFALSFHVHFHRLLKWLLAGPFAAACLAVLAQRASGFGLGIGLPSTQ